MAAIAVCECGWHSQRMTAPRAEYAGRRHLCERFAIETARADRVATRKAASGPARECTHKIARHEHGTHAAYVLDLCRCRACRDAASRYERHRAKQRAYGRESYVDAGPAREHVRALTAAGLGLKRIAKVSGVPHGALAKLIYGDRARGMEPSKRIRPAVSVDATGTHRRLQALVTVGWSQSKLAVRLGMDARSLWGVLHRPLVHAETARKVRALYDELWKIAPPEGNQRDRIAASRARNYAAAHGWKPPLWWGEDEIDRPVIEDVLLDLADDYELDGDVVALAVNKTEIARRLRLSGATVDTLLAHLQEAAA